MNTDKIYAQQLANEYAPKKDSKIIAIKKLDKKAKFPANVFAYTFGIIASLVFGAGMCISMGVIGSSVQYSVAIGIVVGIVGMIGMGINFSVYKKILAKGKEKYAFEIIELAKEISGEE